jgi:hypothetical protein
MFLLEERDFLLRLLENPTLLEHESFTDLLRAVFHHPYLFSLAMRTNPFDRQASPIVQ